MVIDEANKRVIRNDSNVIKPGQRLQIPDLEGQLAGSKPFKKRPRAWGHFDSATVSGS